MTDIWQHHQNWRGHLFPLPCPTFASKVCLMHLGLMECRCSAGAMDDTARFGRGEQRQRDIRVVVRIRCTFVEPKHMWGPIKICGKRMCTWSGLRRSARYLCQQWVATSGSDHLFCSAVALHPQTQPVTEMLEYLHVQVLPISCRVGSILS